MLVSIRPEAARVNASEGVNTVFAKVRESHAPTSEKPAQIVALVASGHDGDSDNEGVEWKIAVLNPLGHGLSATMANGPATGGSGTVKHLTLSVSPGDVVVLPMPPHLRVQDPGASGRDPARAIGAGGDRSALRCLRSGAAEAEPPPASMSNDHHELQC